MHGAQCRVAVLDVIDEDADRADVVKAVQALVLALHFAPDTVDVFRAAGNFCLDSLLVQFVF